MSKYSLLFLLALFLSSSVAAQNVDYQVLVNRSQRPEIFINSMLLPGDNGKTTLAFTFRFNNDFLPYKKLTVDDKINAPDDAQFYTITRLNSEIFMGHEKGKLAAAKAAARAQWSDTLFAETFERTQSRKHYASGSLSTTLKAGLYNYVLQLSLMKDNREVNTRRQNIRVHDLSKKKTGEIYWIKETEQDGAKQNLPLINMDNNVPFGKDFYALVRIPEFTQAHDYTIEINEVRPEKKDTLKVRTVYTEKLSTDQFKEESTISLSKGENPSLIWEADGGAFTYALLQIPNSTFRNSAYKLTIVKEGQKSPVATHFFRSYWPDMPASLYNLNVALNNLQFIVSDKELKRLKSGNEKEKRDKFREFWESKDPTPGTVYNELMAEYYRRIDYAYKEFRSEQNPMGHKSDQGKIYIKFGPPKNKERLYPTDEKVREIWTYGNRKFVFETGSGFGDFVLIGSS
ncbi:MAG: GWxTD domain-containing protein [Balneolaceae bacterium]|nr:GWxTD domain-containing protein [Balneolaceae bacterium]